MEDVWTTIDDRQRGYLRACYTIYQDSVRRNQAAHKRGAMSSESDWLLYGPTLPASPLLHRLRLMKLVDSETPSTFRSLELLGLLCCRYDVVPTHDVLLYVQMTPKGCYIVRNGLGFPTPVPPTRSAIS